MQLRHSDGIVWRDGDVMGPAGMGGAILGMEEFRESLGTVKEEENAAMEWLSQAHSRSARSSLPLPRSGCRS